MANEERRKRTARKSNISCGVVVPERRCSHDHRLRRWPGQWRTNAHHSIRNLRLARSSQSGRGFGLRSVGNVVDDVGRDSRSIHDSLAGIVFAIGTSFELERLHPHCQCSIVQLVNGQPHARGGRDAAHRSSESALVWDRAGLHQLSFALNSQSVPVPSRTDRQAA